MGNLAIFRNTAFKDSGDIIVPANTTRDYSFTGKKIRFLKTTGLIQLRLNERDFVEVGAGLQLGVEPGSGDFFNQVTFRNPTAEDVTIRFLVFQGEVDDSRLNLIRSRDVLQTEDATTRAVTDVGDIAANDDIEFTGSYNANDIKRRSFVVTNKDSTLSLFVGTAANDEAILVGPRESIEISTSATLWLVNPNGSAIAYGVLETIYTDLT